MQKRQQRGTHAAGSPGARHIQHFHAGVARQHLGKVFHARVHLWHHFFTDALLLAECINGARLPAQGVIHIAGRNNVQRRLSRRGHNGGYFRHMAGDGFHRSAVFVQKAVTQRRRHSKPAIYRGAAANAKQHPAHPVAFCMQQHFPHTVCSGVHRVQRAI